jgi:hypothetical protein
MSTATRLALITALMCSCLMGEDAYAPWSAGRPGESLPLLHAQAQAKDTWDAWLDLGLCAAAAERRGPAVVWLLEAQRRAPARSEPRQALASLGAALPDSYAARLGVFALPGSGALAPPLAAIAGLLLGYGVLGRRGRLGAVLLGSIALLAIVPGATAVWLDARHQWLGAASDTQLLDSTGAPLRAVAAGTIAERLPGPAWNGRLAVRLGEGSQGWLAEADTRAVP